jgi:hypothetical protein
VRTTLTIDDDVWLAVRERARRESRTAGQVLSDLARRALTNLQPAATVPTEPEFHGFAPLPHRGEAISNTLIDRLREEYE